jgi:AhpD family alkylhydroperoxidase
MSKLKMGIKVNENFPGIVALMKEYPATAGPLNDLAASLLEKDTPKFPKAYRELLASYVSFVNGCVFCSESHGAVADVLFGKEDYARKCWQSREGNSLMEAYFELVGCVRSFYFNPAEGWKWKERLQSLKNLGATDEDIHDAVLICSAFNMFNRYVEALAPKAPPRGDPMYKEIGKMLAKNGYRNSVPAT